MVKDSLKIRQDQESVLFMTTLGEFESYFRSTYIVGQNLVQDLLSRLFSKQKPSTYEESINNITSALNGMKILQKKKLERVITDIQLEQIMSKCLLSSDQSEFFREWAKEKGSSVLSSTFLEGDDEEVPLDFNKTISDEIDFGTMEVKREFLTRFLVRKQLELMEILASRRTRNYTRREVGSNTKFVKFRDKMFQMTEVDEDEDITEEILNEYLFLTTIGGKT